MSNLISHFRAEYTPRQIKILAPYGIVATLVYVATLVIGNILDPSYSQMRNTVSELFENGAPNRLLIDTMFIVYGLFLIPFAEGLYKSFSTQARAHPYSLAKGVFVSLFIIAVCSLLWNLFFPLDANGGYGSFTGMMHIVLSVPVVFSTLFGELSFWKIAEKDSYWRGYARFSIAVFAANLLAGLSLIVFANSDIRGLLERFSIGSFLLWMGVLSLRMYSSPLRTAEPKLADRPRLLTQSAHTN